MISDKQLKEIEQEVTKRLGAITTLDELNAQQNELLGKKSKLAELNQSLGELSPEDKRAAGQQLNEVRTRLSALAESRRGELEQAARVQQLEAERLDLDEVIGDYPRGHLHLVTQTQMQLEDTFVGMGFEVHEGPEVESDWNNFEALNFVPGHPARNTQDSFHVDLGTDGSVLLRTHTSPMQIRLMTTHELPIYAVIPGRTYRRDTADARHLPYFNQIEGLVVDKGITFADLAGTIDTFIRSFFGPEIKTRLRPASFPFTEPSAEFEITCYFCGGEGCSVCSSVGWIELGGAGMVDPQVFINCGIDPEEWSGFAFGFGMDRLPMMRHGIDDLRRFVENDIRFVSQF